MLHEVEKCSLRLAMQQCQLQKKYVYDSNAYHVLFVGKVGFSVLFVKAGARDMSITCYVAC